MGQVKGKTTQAIYETSGRAKEYNELAINLSTGCGHQCAYCYGADVLQKNRQVFYQEPAIRKDIIPKIENDCIKLQAIGEDRPVLMCFVTDPYQPIEAEHFETRLAIQILQFYGFPVVILTKGGHRAVRDFDILRPGIDQFATTLTFNNDDDSLQWEPGAATPVSRIESLRKAHDLGIRTWVSLEPVIYPEQALDLIKCTHTFVDHYKVGILNYSVKLPARLKSSLNYVNWTQFGMEVVALLRSLNKSYYIKNDLKKYLDKIYWEGYQENG
jgi:DNA repair photolyase